MKESNRIEAEKVDIAPISEVRSVKDPVVIGSEYPAYLIDESKMTGWADFLFFPRSEEELASVFSFSREKGVSSYISGARTGISGSAVPQGGGIISTDKMSGFLGLGWDETQSRYFIRVEPAVTLSEIERVLSKRGEELIDLTPGAVARFKNDAPHHYPVDPTEQGASIGGTVATNASGARTFKYGPTRNWVKRIRVMLASGDILDITRGEYHAKDGSFIIELSNGEEREIPIPKYLGPLDHDVKNAAGICAYEGMDLIDLFIGSEGVLSIITLIEVWLKELKPQFSSVLFLDDLERALEFVIGLRSDQIITPEYIELLDGRSLRMLRDVQEALPTSLGVPPIPVDAGSAVLFDIPFSEETIERDLERIGWLAGQCNSSLERSWCGHEGRELERFFGFRHAVPETVNAIIAQRKREHPAMHKLGTDISVPDGSLLEMMSFYTSRMDTSGLDYVIFGHIGDNHPHLNILPRNQEELERGKVLYQEFAQKAVALGGSVSAEHGIGKLKRDFLRIMYGDKGVEEMRRIKRSLDPGWMLSPGNIFEPEVGN
ncbi:MAG: FAD-binding oxidoreductase [Methanomassiliicoccales archaeon]|nr:FAD-binding oxidoreductase [Methanomassiliicoccales archaeon]NYT15629.1 FAD-binding oxidoreductase [Methanomassiliicoccales archaeon]